MVNKKSTENTDEILKQDLNQKGNFQNVYFLYLLFEKEEERPSVEKIKNALTEKLGKTDIVSGMDTLSSFAIQQFPVTYQDNEVPAQVMMADFNPIQRALINDIERTQQWDCPEWEKIWNTCQYQLMISDFMAGGLPYKQRCQMLISWIEVAMELFPDCKGIWNPVCGKLLTRQQILENPYNDDIRFLYIGINIRFFNIQNTPDSLVDTLGLYAFNIPDIQYHFHDLDPNAVVGHAFNVAAYIFGNEIEIKDGDTMPGLKNGLMDPDTQWKCQYEESLIQPVREVIDICPGEFASGKRE